jgi:hypothetical protein
MPKYLCKPGFEGYGGRNNFPGNRNTVKWQEESEEEDRDRWTETEVSGLMPNMNETV